MKTLLTLITTFLITSIFSQTSILVMPDSIESPVGNKLDYGTFLVPKTQEGFDLFMAQPHQYGVVRNYIIESALNNGTDSTTMLQYMDLVYPNLQQVESKCAKQMFIFEKMPAWLSSSSNPNPAQTPGWSILNTKPPQNWSEWKEIVKKITSKISNEWGFDPYYEIWNEPDLGSWTGSDSDFFKLYKTTYEAIKEANPNALVGGLAMNYWASNLTKNELSDRYYYHELDSALIFRLIDSVSTWGYDLDFVSYHHFNTSYQEYEQATKLIRQKLNNHGFTNTPIIVSEWNLNSFFRDKPYSPAFMPIAMKEMSQTELSGNCLAAWQDFENMPNEFHQDYGLVSYNGIEKPALYGLELTQKMKGDFCKSNSTAPHQYSWSTIHNDTLYLMIPNYSPIATIEAMYSIPFDNENIKLTDLDSLGYINLNASNIDHLDSIFKGLISLSPSNHIDSAVVDAIHIYNYFDTISNNNRNYKIQVEGITSNESYAMNYFIIDSNINNNIFLYDSLLNNGYNQSSASLYLYQNQSLKKYTGAFTNEMTVNMSPNSVILLQIDLSHTTSISDNFFPEKVKIFPNPSTNEINFNKSISQVIIYDITGKIVLNETSKGMKQFDISMIPSGTYFIQVTDNDNMITSHKILKQ